MPISISYFCKYCNLANYIFLQKRKFHQKLKIQIFNTLHLTLIIIKQLVSIVNAIFQLDKDWVMRITKTMIVMSVVWGALGVIDALLVKIQEASRVFTQTLLLTPLE
jgi:hypothetical protein